MRCSYCNLRTIAPLFSTLVVLAMAWNGGVSAVDPPNYVFSPDAFNKMVAVLGDLRAKNIPLSIGGGNPDAEISKLQKQPKVESIIKKRGLSVHEFVLTYKAAEQIRESEKARDNWGKTLADPDASPQAKLEATQKLGDSLRTNLFTPEQIELVRHKMPELETLTTTPK